MTRGKARKPLFEEQTPVPHVVSQVTLFEDIWRDKIVVEHPEMAGHLQDEPGRPSGMARQKWFWLVTA